MTANLRHAAGSLLVVGLAGTELTNLERAWLKLVRPAGIILFRRNIESSKQTRALLDEASNLCAERAFLCVDVEGGTVDRLRDALAPLPAAQTVMRAAAYTGNKGLIRAHGELVAQGVSAFGFNTTLAPVLDLALPESASVLGTRAAAAKAKDVVEYARGFLAGLAARGVVGCGKHFPGLGGGTLDSHHETPAIRRGPQLWNEDLVPYFELCDELPMIMVSHAAFPDQKSGDLPASVSPFWIGKVLRKRIGYKGIAFSDDLEMGGILKFMSMEEAAVAAIGAGMGLLEVCHSPELILRAYEALIAEAERSRTFKTLLLARARQTAANRAKLLQKSVSQPLDQEQFEALRINILRFAETIAISQPTEEAQPR